MRGARKLFQIFGIDIQIHYSWWIVFIFLSWVLSTSFFPSLCSGQFTEGFFSNHVPSCAGLSNLTYWIMGITASLLLFVSVLLHELSHSLIAKFKKIKVESITLFFFGGVAGITKEEMKPSSEFLMAIAGPLFSIFLGVIFLLINRLFVNGISSAITLYLYMINFILAAFNLVPAYPLDGGRALRAILYWWTKDLLKATRIASFGGKFFAGYLVLEGILNIFGYVIIIPGGLWFILLGGFLWFIAGLSYQQVVLKDVLSKVPLNDFIVKKIPLVKPEVKFKLFLQKYTASGEDVFLVQGKDFQGVLDLKLMAGIPPKMQEIVRLRQIAVPMEKIKGLQKSDSAYTAFQKFAKQNVDILPVMEKGKVVGIVRRTALFNRLQWELSAHGHGGRRKRIKGIKKEKKKKD